MSSHRWIASTSTVMAPSKVPLQLFHVTYQVKMSQSLDFTFSTLCKTQITARLFNVLGAQPRGASDSFLSYIHVGPIYLVFSATTFCDG